MKTLITFSFFLLSIATCLSQEIPVITSTALVDFTIEGSKVGWSVGKPYLFEYKNSDDQIIMDTGLFYQYDVMTMTSFSESQEAREEMDRLSKIQNREVATGGIYVGIEARRDKIRTGLNLRAGIKNGEDLIVIPTITVARQVLNFLSVGTGLSIRSDLNPGIQFFVAFK
ncbi:hypothetical protein [Reichenbachiella versicolor]|uniref:hypothetical protein n=1 Tax=Reichenbachiella versicolor TaxID=1821036 RepID=UPI000D6DEF81|nr:hypothetical protein [Reichenbachiella versicolor]